MECQCALAIADGDLHPVIGAQRRIDQRAIEENTAIFLMYLANTSTTS
jgi:hypothetical protein